MLCEIQWTDTDGQPTPDTNPAIGMVWMIAHQCIRDDLTHYWVPQSKEFAICADHAKRLPRLNHQYPIWCYRPLCSDEQEE